jgi:hypothetical protein
MRLIATAIGRVLFCFRVENVNNAQIPSKTGDIVADTFPIVAVLLP